jgi:hypothetical protein
LARFISEKFDFPLAVIIPPILTYYLPSGVKVKVKVKIALLQAMEAHSVARG